MPPDPMRPTLPLLLALLTTGPALAAELDPGVIDHIQAASVRIDAVGSRSEAQVSGVVVDASGLILTSSRALGCVDTFTVTVPSGHQLDARPVLIDDSVDVAILAVKPKRSHKLEALEPGPPPGPGATVHGWGRKSQLRSGAVRRVEGGHLLVRMASEQPDVGGPLTDAHGRLVGLVGSFWTSQDPEDPRTTGVTIRALTTVLEATNPDGRISKKTFCAGSRQVWGELREATTHLEQGNSEAAETLLGLSLGRKLPEDLQVQLRLLRAEVRLASLDLESAIIDLTAALELEPDNLQALVARGLARNTVGRSEAALRDLDLAIQNGPDDLRAWSVRAQIFYDLDRKEEAEQAVRDWASAGGRGVGGLGLMCRLHLDRAGYDDAKSSCLAAIASGWSEPRVFVDRARRLRERGDFGGALATLDVGLDGGLKDPAARYERTLLRLHFDRAEEALADAILVTEQRPGDGPAWYARAYALGRLGRPAEAIAAARRAAELGQPGAEELVTFLKAGGQPGRLELQ